MDAVSVPGPHDGARVVTRGPSLADASAAVVTLHGRDATPAGILSLTDRFDASGVAYLAPAAADRSWYDGPLAGPVTDGDRLAAALAVVSELVERAREAVGRDHVGLFGFGEGGCVAAEWLARNPAPYGGVVVCSGALIERARDDESSDRYVPESGVASDSESKSDDAPLARGPGGDGTPMVLGCSDADPHVPVGRVRATADQFERLGGAVDLRFYEGLGHAVTDDELAAANAVWLAMRG